MTTFDPWWDAQAYSRREVDAMIVAARKMALEDAAKIVERYRQDHPETIQMVACRQALAERIRILKGMAHGARGEEAARDASAGGTQPSSADDEPPLAQESA